MENQFKDLSSLMTDKNAGKIAEEIVYIYLTDNKIKTIDFSYDLSMGKMSNTDANTTFAFDIDDNKTLLYMFKKLSFQNELSSEEEQKICEFMSKVATYLIFNHRAVLKNIVRKNTITDSDPNIIPLDVIEVCNIDILDLEKVEFSAKNTIKVNKMRRKDMLSTSVTGTANDLFNVYNNTGETLSDIIARKKIEGDPKYEEVVDAEWIRYLFEGYLVLYVDYSPVSQDELLDKIKAKE